MAKHGNQLSSHPLHRPPKTLTPSLTECTQGEAQAANVQMKTQLPSCTNFERTKGHAYLLDTLTMQIQWRTYFFSCSGKHVASYVSAGGTHLLWWCHSLTTVTSSDTKKCHAHLTAANVSALFPQFVETVFGGTDDDGSCVFGPGGLVAKDPKMKNQSSVVFAMRSLQGCKSCKAARFVNGACAVLSVLQEACFGRTFSVTEQHGSRVHRKLFLHDWQTFLANALTWKG